jgi:hypothetical protein
LTFRQQNNNALEHYDFWREEGFHTVGTRIRKSGHFSWSVSLKSSPNGLYIRIFTEENILSILRCASVNAIMIKKYTQVKKLLDEEIIFRSGGPYAHVDNDFDRVIV